MSEARTIAVSWHMKLRAWWEGYDAQDYAEWRDRADADGSESDDASLPPSIALPKMMSLDDLMEQPQGAVGDIDPAFEEEAIPDPVWPRARIEISQRIFGPGFLAPGGAEAAIELAKPLGLDPVQSVLDLTVGLGGPGAALAERYGVWLTGYERNPALLEQSATVLPTIKSGDQVRSSFYDPDTLELPRRKFDVVLFVDEMHRISDRLELITKIADSLKDWGQFLLGDYVVPDESPPSDRLQAWMDGRGEPVTLWTQAQYETALANHGFDVRVIRDVSQTQAELIRNDFARFVSALDADRQITATPVGREALMALVEDWARLATLLQDGELQLLRIVSMKPGES